MGGVPLAGLRGCPLAGSMGRGEVGRGLRGSLPSTHVGIMKSGFLTLGGRGVKEKEGLNAGKTISGVESSCNTLSGTNQDNMATKNLLNAVEFGCELIKEDIGNVSVWVKFHGVPMKAFSKDRLSVIATKLGTPLMRDSYTSDMCMHSWGKSSYARAMIELRANVEYEWKPPKCLSCKVFGHVLNEFPKKIISDVAKNLKNPRQATRGVPVGPKVSFKSTNQIYRPVYNKNGGSTSGKKKQVVACRQEVSKSNLFDALNLIENDDDLGTNGGISKSAKKGSLNVAHGSSSNTHIIDKIEKLECQIVTTINFQKFK
ncbi:reverse transcriptase domain-containing protein [Tanacetum coccineum]